MKILLTLIIMTLVISGCSTMDTAKFAVSHAVERYCSLPEMSRAVARQGFDSVITPNSIKVTCIEHFYISSEWCYVRKRI